MNRSATGVSFLGEMHNKVALHGEERRYIQREWSRWDSKRDG